MKNIIYLLAAVFVFGCAFETEDPSYYYSGPGETKEVVKYKRVFIGACGFSVSPILEIPDDYKHYENYDHHIAVKYFTKERGDSGSYDNLVASVPCAACIKYHLSAIISVYDDKVNLMPWGWGRQRPPLSGVKGFVSMHDGFTHTIDAVPDMDDELGVAFDVDEVCEVLVKSGALKPLAVEDL